MAIRVMRASIAFVALLGGLGPLPLWAQARSKAVSPQELRATDAAEKRLCSTWEQKFKSLAGSDARPLMRAVAGKQPRWARLDPMVNRRLLEEWIFKGGQYPAPQRSMSRREASDLLDAMLRAGEIRLWQATARSREVPGTLTVTRVGTVPRGAKPRRGGFAETDFDKNGYRFILSSGKPAAQNVTGTSDHYPNVAFLDGGFLYFAALSDGSIRAPSVSTTPSGRAPVFGTFPVCR